MKKPMLHFPTFDEIYIVLFFAIIGLTPLYLALETAHGWILSIGWIGGITALSFYASHLCSSPNLPYWKGLRHIAASMLTGWIYFSMVFVFPALLLGFIASIGIALYGGITGNAAAAQAGFHHMVHFFYRNRLRQ